MTLDRQQVLDLLPCYVCGDLPDHVIGAVDAAIETDPTLQDHVHTLRSSREQCIRLLSEAPPPFPFEVDASAAPTEAPAHPPTALDGPPGVVGLVLGIAAAAVLFIAVGSATPLPPSGATVGALHAEVSTHDSALITAASPKALAAALGDHGVSPQLAMAPDMSKMGLKLVGARILGPDGPGDAPGVAVVYERDGERFVCQIQLVRPTHGQPHSTDSAGGVVLRAYRTDHGSVVSWFQGGRWCVFGGPAEPVAMLAMVKARMTRG